MNITQSGTSLPSMAYFANKLPLFRDYVAFQTGDYEYTLITGNIDGNNYSGDVYVLTRSTGSYSQYTLKEYTEQSGTLTVSNELYTYSNIGIGQAYTNPNVNNALLFCIALTTVLTLINTAVGGWSLWNLVRRKRY